MSIRSANYFATVVKIVIYILHVIIWYCKTGKWITDF